MTDMPRRWRRLSRVVIWTTVLLLVLISAGYTFLTHPTRLRGRLLRVLAAQGFEQADVGLVTFSLSRGIEFVDLALFPGPGGRGAGRASPTESHVSVAYGQINCVLSTLLTGRLLPKSVILDGVDVELVRTLGSRQDGRIAATPNVPSSFWSLLRTALPTVQLRQANVRLLAAQGGAAQLTEQWRVCANGAPTQDGYRLQVLNLGHPQPPLVDVRWTEMDQALALAADWLDVEALSIFLPPNVRRAVDRFDLSGRTRLEQLRIVRAGQSPAAQLVQGTMQVAELRGSIPVEEAEGRDLPGPQRFLKFAAGEATIQFGESAGVPWIELAGTTQVNEGHARFRLRGEPPAWRTENLALPYLQSLELSLEGMHFPTRQSDSAFVTSPRLPQSLRFFINDFAPAGPFDLHVRAERPAPAGEKPAPLAISGELLPRNARARPREFPYDFENVAGRVTFSATEGIVLERLTGEHGAARVSATGHVTHAGHAAGFGVWVAATNVTLDEKLFAALPTRYQRLWSHASPVGLCDVRVHLRRDRGPAEEPKSPPTAVEVDAQLLAGSVRLGPERRLQRAEGRLSIAGGCVQVQDLHGFLDDTGVLVNGTVGVDVAAQDTDLHVELMDVPLRREIDIPVGGSPTPPQIHFAGTGDVRGHVHGLGRSEEQTAPYRVHVKRGVLHGFDGVRAWEPCTGWISILPDWQMIEGFAARQGAAELRATGMLPAGPASGTPARLDLRIDNAALESLVTQLIPPPWVAGVQALRLSGVGGLRLQLRPEPAGTGPPRQVAELDVDAPRMQPDALPVLLEQVAARAVISGSGVDVSQLTGSVGAAGRLSATGRLAWDAGAEQAEFAVAVRDVELGPQVLDAFPMPLARVLWRLAPTGRLALDLSSVQYAAHTDPRWQVTGELALTDGSLQVGPQLTQCEGRLRGACRSTQAGQTHLDAEIKLARGLLAGRLLTAWDGRLRYETGTPWVRLEDLQGRLCGGDAFGFARFDPDSSEYEVSLTMQNVALAELVRPRETDTTRTNRGVVDGNVIVRGTAGRDTTRTGGGRLRIRGASMLHTPVLAEVAAANPPAQPASDAADLVDLQFVWQGQVLNLTRVDLESRDLRLVGEGTWNLETDELSLTLVGAHPRSAPRLGVVTDLLESAGQELMQYRVTGTLASPRVRAEPLHRLNEGLRKLLEGG